MVETWKDLDGYDRAYAVSDLGRVKRTIGGKETILKQNGLAKYKMVGLRKDGKSKPVVVHRLIATAFVPNPNCYPMCGHDNDDSRDNRASNLYWTTAQENSTHNDIHLRKKKASDLEKRDRSFKKFWDRLTIEAAI